MRKLKLAHHMYAYDGKKICRRELPMALECL